MKFASKLSRYSIPEWRENYLDYRHLKGYLKDCLRCTSLVDVSEIDGFFLKTFILELRKIRDHFYAQHALIISHRLPALREELIVLLKNGTTNKQTLAASNLKKKFVELWRDLELLEEFVQLNIMAVYKILKKRQKIIKDKNHSFTHYKTLYLDPLQIEYSLKDEIKNLYQTVLSDDSPGSSDLHTLARFTRQETPRWIPCFVGASLILGFNIVLMCCLPPTNPNYDFSLLLKYLPFFRLSLMTLLFLWFAGGAMRVMEMYGINYGFLLEMDGKCEVQAGTVWGLAVLQTVVWIISFGCLVLDFKFIGFTKKKYIYIYPLVLIIGHIATMLLPSKTFRYRYRRQILQIFFSVLSAGLFLPRKITLSENMLGDILTSFSHPLGDLQHIAADFVSIFGSETNWFYNLDIISPTYVRSCIHIFPFYLRFCQCLIRWKLDHQNIHWLNALKYITGIMVGVAALFTLHHSVNIYILAYIIATIYMFLWDIIIDWGIWPHKKKLLLSHKFHLISSVVDFLCRITWATTLTPIELLADRRSNAVLIGLIISVIEIFRRSLWIILRLENEHLFNSSAFRATLWVPCPTNT